MSGQNSFGRMEGSVKALVRMCGEAAAEETFTMSSLNPEQRLALIEICSNPNHPWMIEYSQGIAAFGKELIEKKQKELDDAELKDKRKKRLTLKTKKYFGIKKCTAKVFMASSTFNFVVHSWLTCSLCFSRTNRGTTL